MVTELVLLLAVYAICIIGLFLDTPGPADGAVQAFTQNLPKLSARIEKHTATGYGFWNTNNRGVPFTWGSL